MTYRLSVVTAALMGCLHMAAQTDSVSARPQWTEHMRLISMGHTDLLDTYLLQEKSTGWNLGYVSQRLYHKEGRRLVHEAQHEINFSGAGTRSNKKSMLSAMYSLKLGWYGCWNLADGRLRLMAGGQADASFGATYNTRNSNNPAQARASVSIDPAAKLRWQSHIGRWPLTLHYDVGMPLIGLAFSPNYGQSYYEIFSEGNYDHNVVVTSPFTGPQLHQLLAIDFRLWRTTFTIGYKGDIRQMRANSLKYHQYTHSIVIGWRY